MIWRNFAKVICIGSVERGSGLVEEEANLPSLPWSTNQKEVQEEKRYEQEDRLE
jgi:hypothetical protein